MKSLEDEIFNIKTSEDFEVAALKVFQYQYDNVSVYRKWCELLNVYPTSIHKVSAIPFLPISFFKNHIIIAEGKVSDLTFTSSGTTGQEVSTHYVASAEVYTKSFQNTIKMFYGDIQNLNILALLPSYIERSGSSLIYMVESLIKTSKSLHSGFYLYNEAELIEKLHHMEKEKKKTILIGVSFALLDLVENHTFNLKNTIVMETGGMKGRRKEMIREELHAVLKKGFGVNEIHSEYGMTEMLSQGYSKGSGIFKCPPWMKVYTRNTEDALELLEGKTGGLNIIDLANLYSCSFLATQDLGNVWGNGTFEVLGRFDSSDIRGCNLMVF